MPYRFSRLALIQFWTATPLEAAPHHQVTPTGNMQAIGAADGGCWVGACADCEATNAMVRLEYAAACLGRLLHGACIDCPASQLQGVIRGRGAD